MPFEKEHSKIREQIIKPALEREYGPAFAPKVNSLALATWNDREAREQVAFHLARKHARGFRRCIPFSDLKYMLEGSKLTKLAEKAKKDLAKESIRFDKFTAQFLLDRNVNQVRSLVYTELKQAGLLERDRTDGLLLNSENAKKEMKEFATDKKLEAKAKVFKFER
ncbi:MAG: hypothetical protein KDD70_16875 [Bdellovibrionales bacterium]|nr:hypothetical protein [Bdellovibrionales bacterium]